MDVQSLLVFGATGTQGHPVVDAALEAGLEVRAATRDVSGAAEKLSTRVDIIEADLHEQDAIGEAMAGVDAVFFHLPILPSAAETPLIVDNVIAAARANSVKRLVFSTSGYCGDEMPPGAFVSGLRQVTHRFLSSGLDTVVLRPTLYLANLVWPNIIRDIREFGRLCYPPLSEKRRLNWTATEDQGQLVVACLERADRGEIIDIASPEPVTGPELCRLLAGVYGREVHYAPQSTDDFADMLSHLASSAEVGRTVAGLYEGINSLPNDGPLVNTDALEKRFDVRLTPVSEWVEDRLGTLLDLYG